MCGESARTRRHESSGSSRFSSRSAGVIFSAYVAPSSACGDERRRFDHLLEQAGGDLRGALEDAACVEVADRERFLRRDRAGVERLDRLVDRHARLAVAREDRPLDRRRAAPPRQQRRMDVQPERAREQPGRDVEAVRADDDALDLGGQLRPLRLVDGDAELAAPPPSPAARRACRPRPRGASGRVSSQATSCVSARRSSTSAPSGAVAATPMRISAGRRGAAASRAPLCGARRRCGR